MIHEKLEKIQQAHIEDLLTNASAESRTLEFKKELPGRDNSSKHELLADVSALANVAGGDIIFGVEENDEGIACKINEISCNPDEECLRIQDIIGNGIEPKISGVHMHAVPLSSGKYAFVLRVPQSWSSPHRVKTNQHFFSREGRRKRQMEISEIRTAFIRSDEPAQKIQSFRSGRLAKLMGRETPVPLFTGVIEVLHIIPITKYLGDGAIDVLQYAGQRNLPVISGSGGQWRINLDGVLHSRPITKDGCGAYTQLFRNGVIEAVRVFTTKSEHSGVYNVPSQAYEQEIIKFVTSLRSELKAMEVDGPLVFMWSLLDATKAELGISESERWDLDSSQGRFDRANVVLPDVFVQNLDAPAQSLKVMFDLIWNAAGIAKSMNYDEHGNWMAQRAAW